MKKIIATLLIACSICTASAQPANDAGMDSLFSKFNFVVPDIPAFKGLGIDNSKILTPSSVKDFALDLSPFYSGRNFSFPENFAVELAPAHLSNSLNKISNYNEHSGYRWLLNSSVSLATNREINRTYLSVGIRSSFIKKNDDIKRNLFAIRALDDPDKINSLFKTIKEAIRDSLERVGVITRQTRQGDTQYIAVFKNIKKELQRNEALDDRIGDVVDTLSHMLGGPAFDFSKLSDQDFVNVFEKQKNALVKDAIKKFENKYWNASRFDVAMAYTVLSPDSSAKGAYYYAFDLWATRSFRISDWGQFLIGLNARIPSSDTGFVYDAALTSRLYAGTNKVKGIMEMQYHRIETPLLLSENLLFSLGAEVKLSNSIWAVIMTGYQSRISGSFYNQIVSGVNLKYGL